MSSKDFLKLLLTILESRVLPLRLITEGLPDLGLFSLHCLTENLSQNLETVEEFKLNNLEISAFEAP